MVGIKKDFAAAGVKRLLTLAARIITLLIGALLGFLVFAVEITAACANCATDGGPEPCTSRQWPD